MIRNTFESYPEKYKMSRTQNFSDENPIVSYECLVFSETK